MTKQFVVRAAFFLCAVAGFSVANAQSSNYTSRYTGGNGVLLSIQCNQEPPVVKNEYIDDRDIKVAEFCALDIVSYFNVRQQPCAGASDGIVEIAVERGNGEFYFWWPSRGGTEAAALADLGGALWYKVENPGTVTFTLTGFSATDKDKNLLIYSKNESLQQIWLLDEINAWTTFAPGTITAYNNTICEGATNPVINSSATPTGGNGTYTYQWYKSENGGSFTSISGATSTTYQPSVTTSGTYLFKRVDADGQCATSGLDASGTATLIIYPTFAPGTITAYNNTICEGASNPVINSSATPTGGNGTYTYQWHISENGGNFASLGSGATSTTYQPSVTTPGTYLFKRVDADGHCTTNGLDASGTARLIIYPTFVSGTITAYNNAVCAGATPPVINSSAMPTGGNGSYTYQWYISTNNGGTYTPISGATLTTYAATVTTPGTYLFKRVDADGYCASGGSDAGGEARLLVAELPEVTINTPASTTICGGADPGTLTAQVSKGIPGATYTYTWEMQFSNYPSWFPVPGQTSSTCAPGTLPVSTKFRVKVENGGAGCSSANYSPELSITVHPAFNPGSYTVTDGGTRVNLQPDAIIAGDLPSGGSGSYTYQWYVSKDNGVTSTPISGATLTTYQPPVSDMAAVGDVIYTRQVADVDCGGATITRKHTVHVGAGRTVNLTPIDTAVCNNTPFTITSGVIPGGTYTWYDSTATGTWHSIAGAPNSNVLPVSGKTITDTYYYKVVITSNDEFDGETIHSANLAKIQVWDVFSPGSFILTTDGTCNGVAPNPISEVRVGAATGGSGSYVYQWYKNGLTDAHEIADATAATYQPPVTDMQIAGTSGSVTYWRTVADAICNTTPITTGSYTVYIGGGTYPESINPTTLAVCDGGTITIVAEQRATGSTYTWFEIVGGIDKNIGENSDTLKLTASSGTHYYKVTVNAGGCGLVFNSNPATVTVYESYAQGTLTGSAGTTCVSAAAPEAITGTKPTGGDGNYSYQWYKDGQLIPDAAAESYTPTAEDLKVSGTLTFVRKEKDGKCAEWTSSGTFTLIVQPSPTISLTGSTAFTICNSGSFTLTAGAPTKGTATSYTWEHNAGDGSWTKVDGATAATLTVADGNGPATAGIHYYRAKVYVTTSDCDVLLTTNTAAITVREAFSPGSFLVTEGAACVGVQPQAITALSAPTGGSGSYAYKWYENMSAEVSQAATYRPGIINTPGVKVYSRQVADLTCNTGYLSTTGLFILTIGSGTPTVDIVAAKSTVCGGENITLNAGAVSNGTYTWESSEDGLIWTTRSESKTNTITLPGGIAEGDYYYKVSVATGDLSCNNYISTPATVTVRKAFHAGVFQVTEGAICPGVTPAAITGVSPATGGDGNYSYQWYAGGQPIPGATAATYQPGTFTDGTTVVYTRSAEDGACQTSSFLVGSYTLTVNSAGTSTINIMPAVQEVCNSTAFTVTSGEPAGALNGGYTWYGSTDGVNWNVIKGQDSKLLNVAGTTTGTYYYKVEVLTSGTCSKVVISAPATVTVRRPFTPGEFIVTEGGVCVGAQPQAITGVTNPTGGSANYTYQWYKNSAIINGATEATYQPPLSDAAAPGMVVYTRKAADATCTTGLQETLGSFTLKVGGAPTTNILPASLTVCNNTSSVLTAGLTVGTYTWEESSDEGITWNTFGTNSRNVTIPATTAAGTYYYRVTVTTDGAAGCNKFVSTPSTITVRKDFNAGTFHITAGNACTGEVPATIYASEPTGGSGNYTYQWYKNSIDATGLISGATAEVYQPAADAAGTYYRQVADVTCANTPQTTSGNYVLTVGAAAPTTNLNPAVLAVCNGGTITIATDAYATGSYTWSESADGTNYSVVNGQKTNVLNTTAATGTHYYKVKIEGASTCSADMTSAPATVTVRKAFNAGEIETTGSICAGVMPATIGELKKATGGDEHFSYRWYKNGQPISGATAATYTPKAEDAQTAGTVSYTRAVKDGACAGWTLSANTYTLTVTAAPTVTLQKQTVTACHAEEFSLAVTSPTVGVHTYAWEEYVNGAWIAVQGESSSTLKVTKNVAGDYYYRAKLNVTEGACVNVDAYSAAATVTVHDVFNAGSFTVSEGAACIGAQPQAITGVSVPTGGGGTYTYQWYKNGTAISGATAATYQPPVSDAAAAAIISYTRKVTDTKCNTSAETAGTFTLKVGGTGATTTNIVPDQATVCNGAAVTFTAGTVTGAQTYTWAMSSNGTDWTNFGTNSHSVTASGQTAAGAYYYRVTVQTSATCSPIVISTPATVTVRQAFNAGAFQVTAGSICPGATPAAITGVSAATGGDGHYTYQWYAGSQPISGATNATYQPGTFTDGTTVVYTRGAKDATCQTTEVLAGSYTLTVSTSATSTINLTPAAKGICGDAFTVTSGTPDGAQGYTWYGSTDGVNWNQVLGQTNKVLSVANATAGVYYYRVTVLTSSTCSPLVTSTPATITVYGALSAGTFLTTEGAIRVNETPEAITGVSDPTGGSGHYTYQWYKNGQLVNNATGATYRPPVSDASAVGNVVYTREVTDAECGGSEYTSGSYTLKVGANPTTNIVPVNITVCNNTAFTLTAGAYSGGTYTWEESANGVSWASIAGTTNVLNVPAKTTAGVYYYNVTITTATETIKAAAAATVTVGEPFSAGTFHVTEGSVCAEEIPATIYPGAPAGGSGTYTYQWYKDGKADGNKIAGATAAAYRPAAGETGTYYRKVTDACGGEQETSGSYVLTASTTSTANLNPAVLTVCNNGNIKITTDLYNGAAYVWQESTDGSSYTHVGGTTNELSTATTVAGIHYYKVTVYNASACGIVTSTPATVTVRAALNAGGIQATGTVCVGGTPGAISETVAATGGDGHFSYRWYKDGVLIGGATAATYQPKAEDAQTAGTVRYTREVKDGACAGWTLSANTHTLTVSSTVPTVALQTPTVTACNATSFLVSTKLPSSGNVNTYAWEENVNGAWTAISGATAQTLTVSGGKPVAGEYYYRAKLNVTDGGCTTDIYSDAATVTVRAAFHPGVFQVPAGSICPGTTPAAITGVSPATGGDGVYTYQWYAAGQLIAGATAATYQPGTFTDGTTVVYTRSAHDATCQTTALFAGSYTLTVSASATATINLVPAAQEICNNMAYTVTSGIPAGAGASTYTWEESADGAAWRVVTGTANTLTVSGQPQAGDYYYRVTVQTSGTCSPVVVSTPATVTVRKAFDAGAFQVTTGAICPGVTPAAITGVSPATGGDGNYSYQWYKDGIAINGATEATYQPGTFTDGTKVVYTRSAHDATCHTAEVFAGSYTLTVSASATSTINLTPVAQSVCSDVAFTVTSGVPDGAQGYTWYRSADGVNWNPVAGTTNVLNRVETATGRYYYKVDVQTGNSCSPVVISTPATVTVYEALNAGTFLTTEGATRVNERPEAITGVSAPTGGSGNYTYQWYKNGQPINNATGATYWPPVGDASAVGSVVYTRKVTDAECNGSEYTSGSYTLKVGANPTTNIIPVSATVCNATPFTLIAGTHNGTYMWEESADGVTWVSIGGPTNVLDVPAKTDAGVYYYNVTIKDGAETINAAAAATITVREAFSAGAFQVTTGSVCTGETPGAIYPGTPAGGSGNYTYQWYKDGVTDTHKIPGATAANYQPAAGATGTYYRKVTDTGCGNVEKETSGNYVLTESSTPTTNLNPAVLAVCNGELIEITSGAYNGGIYIWEESADGTTYTVVGGQSTHVLKTTATTATHYYKVSILGVSCGAITSTPATVTVYEAFNAGKFTVSEGGVCTGEQPQAITGVTTPTGGSGNYTYQWYKNGVKINGATAAVYRPAASDALTVGTVVYTREAADATCATGLTATTGSFTLKVGGAPTTNIVPDQKTICNNAGVTLTAGAVSGGTYTWHGSANGADWTEVGAAAITNTFNVPATANAGDYYYKVTVKTGGSANCNEITSVPATITVREAFSAGTFQVTAGSVCAGETPATIYPGAPAGGSGTYTYQWYKDGTAAGNKIAGATAAAYRPAAGETGTYYRKVTDACGGEQQTSGSYVLTASTTPTTNLNPAVLAVCNGGTITINTDAYAAGSYTWSESADGTAWSAIGGQSTNVLNTTAATGVHYYKVEIKGGACADITSTPATVTVRATFSAGDIATGSSICVGGTPGAISETVAATGGDGHFSYRWYKDGVLIGGATAATYQPKAEDAQTAGTVRYTREVKDGTCAGWTLSANTHTLTVSSTVPTVALQTPTVTACNATSFLVSTKLPSSGNVNTYAWEENVNGAWTAISGATAQTLTVSGGKPVAGEYYYRAKLNVTDGGCTTDIYSDAATVTVRAAFHPGVFQVPAGSICPGTTPAAITGVSPATGGDGVYTYQWYADGQLIAGATAATYQPGTFTDGTTVVYTRSAHDATCQTTALFAGSYTLTVSASATATINLVPAAQEICNNTAYTVTSGIPAGAGASTYTWETSADGAAWAPIAGNNNVLNVTGQSQAGAYYYRVTVQTSGTCSPVVVSTPATVTVRKAFNAGAFQVTTGNICPGATPAAITGVSAPTGGDGHYTYQWYKNGQLIPGATNATYQPGTFSSATTAVYTRSTQDGCTASPVTVGSYTLTVTSGATSTINLVPAFDNVCGGDFTVTSGVPDGAQGYTWYESADGTTWSLISGQTDKELTVTNAATGTHYYQVMLQTASTCSPVVVSAPATITVNTAFDPGRFLVKEGGVCVNTQPQAITGVSAPAGGSGNYRYEWYKDGVKINGATAATYQPETFGSVITVVYTRVVTDELCGTQKTADSFTLKVGGAPTTDIVPVNTTVCNNAAVTLTSGAVANFQTYKWERSGNGLNWTDLSQNTKDLQVAGQTTAGTYYYRVTVTTSDAAPCNVVTSTPSTVTVLPVLSAGSFIVTAGAICVNALPAAISGNVTDPTGGDGHYTYQWYKNGQLIPGATNATYQPETFGSATTVAYTRGVKDGLCSTSSYTLATGSYTLTVGAAGTQTTNLAPATQGVCDGGTVGITAVAPADALGYTWQKSADGTNWDVISGQNTNVLSTASGTPGTYYYKVTILSAGTCAPVITSTPATVTVYTDFNAGALSGTTYTETCMRNIPSALASVTNPSGGSGNFTYQWLKNGVKIDGATDATYQPVADDVAIAGAYTYTRQVTDAACNQSKLSAGSYILVVNNAESVVVIPSAPQQVCDGGSFTITASLANNAKTPTGFTWDRSVNSGAWTPIPGATSATLIISSATVTAQYRVRVDVQGETCQGISTAVMVDVAAPFTPGSITAAQYTRCTGGTLIEITSVAEAAGGLGTNTYQWLENGSPVSVGGNSSTYTPSPAGTGTFVYTREVTNIACGKQETSEGAYILRVVDAPVVTVDDKTGCTGGTVSLTAAVVGESSAATYNWQYHNGMAWVNVLNGVPNNANYVKSGQTLTISGITVTTAMTYNYRVEMLTGLSGCGTAAATATLTVSPAPVGGTVKVGATAPICATSTTTLTLENAKGTTYEWYENNGSGNWTLISGATTTQIQVAPASAGTWSYMALVSNTGCSPASSTIGEVYVKNAGKGGKITLTGDPYLCVGQSRTMYVTDWEGSLQWQRNDGSGFQNINAATGATHTSDPALKAGAYKYRVKATMPECINTPTYSDTLELRIYAKSQGGQVSEQGSGAKSITMCHGGQANLKLDNYIGESFEWIFREGASGTYQTLAGANSTTYTLSSQLAQGTYSIRVVVSSGCTPDTSSAMQVVVKAPVNITLSADGYTKTELPNFCRGNELVLKVGGLPDASATWTGTITSGTATSTYTGTGEYWRVNTVVPTAGTYTYGVTYTSEFCAPSYAGPITVDYLPAPDAGTVSPSLIEFCHTDVIPQTFTLSGTGVGTTIMEWQVKNLNDYPGAGGGWGVYDLTGASTISVNSPTVAGAYVFRVMVNNGDASFGACTTTYSNEVQLIKYDEPTIDGTSESFAYCEKTVVNQHFTGSPGAIFTWEKKVDGVSAGTGTGDINESLTYTGTNNAPQTVTYTVTPVIGTKQCQGATSKTITYVLLPKFVIHLDPSSKTNLNCYGTNEGELTYTTLSPSATFTLFKSDGQLAGTPQSGSTVTFTGLGAGTYTLEVHNGTCGIKDTVVIEGPANPLEINNEKSENTLCYGGSTGFITFEITGGTAPYKASINNGAYVDGATSFSGLAASVYSVKVQDANGCIAEKTIEVKEASQLNLNVEAITPVSAAGAHDATATLQATGGSGGDYRYSATGLNNDFSSNRVVGGLSEGMNYVYAKDGNGCMVSVPVKIGQYGDGGTLTISLTAKVTKPLTCGAAADAEITVQAFGGNSPYLYSKDDGVTYSGSNLLTGFGAGVHTITVKDAANRVATIEVIVDAALPISFTAVITKPLSGPLASDAEVTLNAIGTQVFEYSKDDAWQSSNVFGGLGAQTYAFSVRYKDVPGCAATPIVVGIPPYPSSTFTPVGITASITRALVCDGDANAEITVTALGGSGTYSFTKDNFVTETTPSTATVHVFGGLSAGTYYLRVQSGDNVRSNVIQLVVLPALPSPVITNVTPTSTTCGNNNGSIEITATGGVGALKYSLSGVQWSYSNKITNLSAGNYDVLVKDSRGCTSDPATVTVAAIAPVTFDISVVAASAQAMADGQVAVTIAGGQSPYNLRLEGVSTSTGYAPSTTYTFRDVKAGLYTLTVTDANGCAAVKNVLVGTGEPGVGKISVTYTTQDPRCYDAADGLIIVTAQGGSGTYTYSLDDKVYQANNTFFGLPAGTYVVYVKDNATPAQKVYVPNVILKGKEPMSFTATIVQPLSASTATDAAVLITAKGGTAPYRYFWEGVQVSSGYVSGISAGTYNITVQDYNGCSVSGTILITPPVPGEEYPRPAISASIINGPACFGGNDGAIAVIASGGRAPYVYSVDQMNWTANNIITGLAAGTYTVYVKELSLNRITNGPTIVLKGPDKQLTATVVVTSPITAPGAADGAVSVVPDGGSTPYQYSIDAQNTYQYSGTFTGLQAQPYTFYVKDGKGCMATTSVLLADPDKITVIPQITKGISCYGANDAEIVVTASGGMMPYQYQWGTSGWNSSATLTNVAAGSQDIFVRDANGNTASLSVFIPQPMMLAVTAHVTSLPTGGDANGAIAIVASGGSNYYTMYSITPPSATYTVPVVSGLAAGNYTVGVTDSKGCTASANIKLASVDVIVNKTVINLQKGHESEIYTIRLASAPYGNVTVAINDPLNYVTITPSTVTFTPANWGEQEVSVAITPGVGKPGVDVTYYTSQVENTVISRSDTRDDDYLNIKRVVIVNITDDGSLNCTKFEETIPEIALDGEFVNSPYGICISAEEHVLSTPLPEIYSFLWKQDYHVNASTTSSCTLTGSGTYTVIVTNADGCKVVSDPFVVNMETAPEVPIILGDRIVREGQERPYQVKNPKNDIDYKWIIPSDYGYRLSVGSADYDRKITMRIGTTSSVLRVVATNQINNSACPSAEGRLDIEVRASYDVDVFPTVASNGAPLKVVPKGVLVSGIAIVNAVGESYAYKILSGKLPIVSGAEMQITVNGLSSGHYFIIFYGREQSDDGLYNGRPVKHTEHIVIKN